jgi:hypothetical protein
MVDRSEIEKTARTARDAAIRFLLEENDYETTLVLLDGLSLTSPELMALLAEIPRLRDQGVPLPAFRAWHSDLLDVLHKILQLALEADVEAQRRSRAVPDALAALGHGKPTGDR